MAMQQHTTVVVQGAIQHGGSTTQAAPQNVRPFSTGICGCFEDCGGCIFAYFLFPCYLCSLAGRMSESCCVPVFLQGGLMAMRTKLRVMYGIQVGFPCFLYKFNCILYHPSIGPNLCIQADSIYFGGLISLSTYCVGYKV